jgi:hypothetical protein
LYFIHIKYFYMKTIKKLLLVVVSCPLMMVSCAKTQQEGLLPNVQDSRADKSLRAVQGASMADNVTRYEQAKKGFLTYTLTQEGGRVTSVNFEVGKLFAAYVTERNWQRLDQELNKLYLQDDGTWLHSPGSEPAALGMLEHLLLRIDNPTIVERQAILKYTQRLIGWNCPEHLLLACALMQVKDNSADWKKLAGELTGQAKKTYQRGQQAVRQIESSSEIQGAARDFELNACAQGMEKADQAVKLLTSARR